MAEVRFEHVSKTFPGDVQAVSDVSLTVDDGSLLVLVGPSGCGKSTTLRMVAGLEEATEGSLYIDGRRVNDVLPKDRNVAMVFQNYALYPHMTVYNNMAFGLKLRKRPKAEIVARVTEVAELLEIGDLLARRPRELSGGQAQRVALGRAIVRHPRVFLFDEPLSNLDAKLRVQMRVEIARLHERLGATMIYVTHDQVEAMTLGERVAVMRDGRVLQVDAPLGLYGNPVNKFVAGFIGSPPMNFVEGRLTGGGAGPVRFVARDFELSLPGSIGSAVLECMGQVVYLGIRPEDIHDRAVRPDAPAADVITFRAEVVEPLGAETLVYLRGPAQQADLVARFDSRSSPRVNHEVQVVFDTRKVYVFDKESEKCLTYQTGSATLGGKHESV